MGFEDFACEVGTVSQKLFEVNTCIVIQKHTSNSWSVIITKSGLNVAIDAVSNKFVSLISLKRCERGDVNWLQVDHLHLSCWLLLHLLWSRLSWWLRHAWLLLLLSLRSSLVVVLSLSILIIVLTLVIVTSVLATSTTSAATPVSTTATSSVVVFVSSVVISHVLILMVLPSLVLHMVLLHLAVITSLLVLLNVDQLKNVVD
jgi:hypothetical protein